MAQKAFEALKAVLISPPVLALPNFYEPFVLEIDASGDRIGAVLSQNGHPMAFITQELKGSAKYLSVYEKEMLAILLAVAKWG